VVQLDLEISPLIFEKNLKYTVPNVIFRGLEEDDSWKKSETKNLVTLSLKSLFDMIDTVLVLGHGCIQ
jgi:hypothetical protein